MKSSHNIISFVACVALFAIQPISLMAQTDSTKSQYSESVIVVGDYNPVLDGVGEKVNMAPAVNDNVDAAKAGENIRKIMSAKDPNDESGKITIPAYAEDSDDSFDSDEEDEAVNFLSFLRNQTDDITVEDEFDDETEEEDLAKLFGDSESDLAEPDGAKGGA